MKRSTAPKSERSRPYLEESNMQNEAKKEIEITQPRTDSFRKRIRCLLFAVFLLTVYATGFLNLILKKGAGSAFTAFGIIKAFFTVTVYCKAVDAFCNAIARSWVLVACPIASLISSFSASDRYLLVVFTLLSAAPKMAPNISRFSSTRLEFFPT